MLRTATALAALLLASSPALAQEDWGEFYAKVYGGVTLPGPLVWDRGLAPGATFAVDRGWLAGGAVGVVTPIEGLSLELDVTRSTSLYTGFPNSLTGTTVMGNVVFTAPVAEMFSIYGGGGAGVVSVSYDNASLNALDSSGTSAAGQVFAGASLDLTSNFSIFGEARYQTAFGYVRATDSVTTYNIGFSRTAFLGGIKVSTE